MCIVQLYPGGVGTVPTNSTIHRLPRPADEVCGVYEEGSAAHDDLFDFFYQALPGDEQVGQRRYPRVLGLFR